MVLPAILEAEGYGKHFSMHSICVIIFSNVMGQMCIYMQKRFMKRKKTRHLKKLHSCCMISLET